VRAFAVTARIDDCDAVCCRSGVGLTATPWRAAFFQFVAIGAILLLMAAVAAGDDRGTMNWPTPVLAVDLPLQGYYRVGRYFPVRWANAVGSLLELHGDGAVTTRIDSPASSGTAPLLAAGSVRNLRARLDGQTPAGIVVPAGHELGVDDRLVGLIGDVQDSELGTLYRGKNLITIRLTAGTGTGAALSGPAAAWTTLDALVISAADFAARDRAWWNDMLCGGTQIVMHTATDPADPTAGRPDSLWPWQRIGPDWIVRCPAAVPTPQSVSAALLVAQSWQPGLPATLRRRVWLATVAAALVGVAVSIGPRRWRILIAAFAIIVMSGFTYAWLSAQPIVMAATADVWLMPDAGEVDGMLHRADQWEFLRADRDQSCRVPWNGLCIPAQASLSAPGDFHLQCRSDGSPQSVQIELTADRPAAIVMCQVTAAAAPAVMPDRRSPLREFASDVYHGTIGPDLSPTGTGGELQPASAPPGQREAPPPNWVARWPGVALGISRPAQ
jgi:hypothetical protein